ncbi:MAG: histidine phosphatase family protein [Rhodospirillaceae bacterium]|nr:MAG: histidine phosphatase family protein [Rhodospirillaceae bacterium]
MPDTIHLIRHGQSTFNAHYEATGEDPMHFDAPLSEIGHRQVAATREALASQPFDLVIASPLTRAIQTASGIFGTRAPIVVDALHREWLNSSCDIGRSVRDLAADFPTLDFAHLSDPWWHVDGPLCEHGFAREPEHVLLDRVASFKDMIAARAEKRIAVIGHGDFFYRLVGRQLKNCEVVTWSPTA